MKWIELSVQTPREYVEPLSSIFLRHNRAGVVVEEPGGYNPDEGEHAPQDALVTLRTYLRVNATTRSKQAQIEVAVRLVSLIHPLPPLQERLINESDWAEDWKKYFKVFHVTPNLVIQPTWLPYDSKDGEVVISMDPGLAFGTGHHPTTSMCLRHLESVLRVGDRVLDVGTGTGILAIGAAKLGARHVLALDIDGQATKAARANARSNRVQEAIKVVRGTLPHPQVESAAFELILANISAKAIISMSKELITALKPTGRLIASGIVDDRANEVVDALHHIGFTVEERVEEGLWVSLVAEAKPN